MAKSEEATMTARDFCYWLQGCFELGRIDTLDAEQTRLIKSHLDMVFVHEIDPSFPPAQQNALDHAHAGGGTTLVDKRPPGARC